jgi:hypothetical protein
MNMNELLAVFKIHFDVSRGPVVEWEKQRENGTSLNFKDFAVNFYCNFMSGGAQKPIALLFEDFDVLAFPKGLDLLTMFLKKSIKIENYDQFSLLAKKLMKNGKKEAVIKETEAPEVPETTPIELVLGDIGRVPYSVLEGLIHNKITTAEDYIKAYDDGAVPIDKIKGLGPKRTELIYAACRRYV